MSHGHSTFGHAHGHVHGHHGHLGYQRRSRPRTPPTDTTDTPDHGHDWPVYIQAVVRSAVRGSVRGHRCTTTRGTVDSPTVSAQTIRIDRELVAPSTATESTRLFPQRN